MAGRYAPTAAHGDSKSHGSAGSGTIIRSGIICPSQRFWLARRKTLDRQFFRAKIFWNEYLKYFEGTPDSVIFAAVRDRLFQKGLPMNENDMIRYIDGSSHESRIESLTIRLMGTPEYQLC